MLIAVNNSRALSKALCSCPSTSIFIAAFLNGMIWTRSSRSIVVTSSEDCDCAFSLVFADFSSICVPPWLSVLNYRKKEAIYFYFNLGLQFFAVTVNKTLLIDLIIRIWSRVPSPKNISNIQTLNVAFVLIFETAFLTRMMFPTMLLSWEALCNLFTFAESGSTATTLAEGEIL